MNDSELKNFLKREVRSEGPHAYYDRQYNGVRLDPYRIMAVYGITHPAQQHAVKKLLRAGTKPGVPLLQEIDEVIATLQRWKGMVEEDESHEVK